MAAGQSSISDEDHAHPDWLEIYNPDSVPVNLGGWHLSDRADKPRRWTFPAVTLPPDGYMVVFASGKNRKPATGNLHTNFSLDGAGGAVILSRPDGAAAQTFAYPAQLPEVSWDGAKFLRIPTPGALNNPAEETFTQAPEFSQPRGFQSGPFTLTMTSGTPDAVIYYTQDGSEPGAGSTRYSTPLRITKTTVIRAIAIAPGNDTSPLTARTFLFPADIVKQSPGGGVPKGWPKTWGDGKPDYGMDPDITTKTPYSKTIKNDLRAVPSFSVVMALDDLFDPKSGIYSNPFSKGSEWERPMSLEYIEPTGGGGFQIQGGIRIRGGASRDSGNPKHSLQFRFRTEYGAANLDYPLFGEDAPSRTDGFDLRWDHLVSWHYSNEPHANQLQDIFARDSQLAASGIAKQGNLVNLYINGLYWGLYFIDERVNGDFGANHFGGASEDYDVIRYDAEAGSTGLNEGSRRAWRAAFDLGYAGFEDNARYFRALGRNPDGSRNPGFEILIDEENLIDYMLVGIWCGATDNPVVGGIDNNWTSIRSRKGDFGFRFFVHDFELSMSDLEGNFIGENPVNNELRTRDADTINPWHFWMAMRMNAEFRMKVADRVQKHFFNGGVLTADACVARWNARMQEMDRAIVAESARWGDSTPGGGIWEPGPIDAAPLKPRPPDDGGGSTHRAYTRIDWMEGATAKRDEYIALRSERMLEHLKNGGLYPMTPAPTMTPFGGTVAAGGAVELLNANGTGEIYYTLDGSDPRLAGGAVSPAARVFSNPISLARKTTIRARVLDGGNWSALVEAEFLPGQNFGALLLTEVHYNPAVIGAETADDGEFIELKNTGTSFLDLSGCIFSEGIEFTFPMGTTLAPGAFFVIARNALVFAQTHPGVTPNGIFTGKLGDDGESLAITTPTGARIFALDYSDKAPWPLAPDGYGPSLVYDGNGNPDDGSNWRSSSRNGGSPGADEPVLTFAPPQVVVNEVGNIVSLVSGGATPSVSTQTAVELHNPSSVAADISGWRYGVDKSAPMVVPGGTIIPPGGYYVVPPSGMPAIDPAGGGTFFIFRPAGFLISYIGVDPLHGVTGNTTQTNTFWSETATLQVPTPYAHELHYGPTPSNGFISYGRHINADGEERFVEMNATVGSANSAPLARSPLRISEIYYSDKLSGGIFAAAPRIAVINPPIFLNILRDFVELENTGAATISLAGMRLVGMNYLIPEGTTLGAGERLVITKSDEASFRAKFPAPGTTVLGPTPGDLQDNGERVALEEPFNGGWRVLDEVRYNDRYPWPYAATLSGNSLHRLPLDYADESAAWVSGPPTPGLKGQDGRPRVFLTAPGDRLVTMTGALLTLAASASDVDGAITKVEFFVDGRTIGESATEPYELHWPAEPGTHDLVARTYDEPGNFTDSETVTVFVEGEDRKDGGNGLKAEYFPNTDFSGDPFTTTVDQIAFDWSELAPAEGIPHRGFSARFSGKLLPRATGLHTLNFRHAGGLRVTMGGTVLIDVWSEPVFYPGESIAYADASIDLVSGEAVDLLIEYFDDNAHGFLSFIWYEPGSFTENTTPQSQLYLPDQDLTAFGISTPSRIADRRMGQRIRIPLESTRGIVPVTWSLLDGQLPPGITLNPAGSLTGAATAGGDYAFQLEARDSAGAVATRTFSLRMTAPAQGRLGPVVRFTRPGPDAEISAEPVVIEGIVRGGLVRLEYSINDGIRHPMSAVSRWSLSLDRLRGLVAGKNTVCVFAMDSSGREGASPMLTFRHRYTSPLSVSINGAGSMTDGFLGTSMRYVGEPFTIRAKPSPGWLFSHWEPDFQDSPLTTFTMTDNMDITAIFVKNPFGPFVGNFVGIIGEGSHTGRYEITVSKMGAFTLKLFIGGARMSLSGKLTIRGNFDQYQDADDRLPNTLNITTHFDTGQFVVTMQYFEGDNFPLYESVAKPATWGGDCPAAGAWTLILPAPGADIPGNGYAAMNVSKTGRATLRGRSGDGARIAVGLRFANDLSLPFQTPLAVDGGIVGTLNFLSQRGRRITGKLGWISSSTSTVVSADGTPYVVPAPGAPALLLPAGDMYIADPNPDFSFATPVRLNTANQFVFPTPGPALPTLSVDPLIGLVRGSYVHPETHRIVQVRGAVNQLTNSAAGVTLGEKAGGFTITRHIR